MSTSTSMSARDTLTHVDAALAVGRRRPDAGPGQLDLPGRVRRTRRAHRERLRIDRLEVRHRVQPERLQDLDLLGPVGDDLSQRVDAGRPAAFSRSPSTSTLPRTSSAVRQSSAARSWRSSIPWALYRLRRPTPTPAIRLRSATSSSRSPHHSRQRHMSHWSQTIGSASRGVTSSKKWASAAPKIPTRWANSMS